MFGSFGVSGVVLDDAVKQTDTGDGMVAPVVVAAGLNALGSVMKGGGPAGPSRADGATENIFDNSGWTVNFGDGAQVSAERSQVPQLGGGLNTTIILVMVGALVAWKIYNKRRK